MGDRGPCRVGWSLSAGVAWQTPAGSGPLPRTRVLPREAAGPGQPWACWLPGLEFGQWLGTYIVRKFRTLSTNWNLKFQRGETGGPYPRVEMALGFFPPRLLFFVLISLGSLHHSPAGVGGR